MKTRELVLSEEETSILRFFCVYNVEAEEMLFFNLQHGKTHSPEFKRAMSSLMEQGLVVQERHQDAFSLTIKGHQTAWAMMRRNKTR